MAKAISTRAAGDLVQQVLERPRALKKQAPPSDGSTTKLTLNVDIDVIAWFKASGGDWGARMQTALRDTTDLDKDA